MNEDLYVVVTITENGVVRSWGPYPSPHHARVQVHTFRREDRRNGHADDMRYVVCKVCEVFNPAIADSPVAS